MKILVAGAGIAGSVLAHMLHERGHEVTVADPAPHRSASRCAYAYTRLDWFHGPDRERVRYALNWYDTHSWLRASTGWVADVRRKRDFDQRGHYLISPRGPLVRPDLAMPLNRLSAPGCAYLGDGLDVRADHVVLRPQRLRPRAFIRP